ncbi:hypothetical protein [Mesorhizobium sp. B2-4-17]|uniref:hypothetical protein n=1 Tax=Mesorhizobium sp. B2-4-17 TaxID=2589932 RepID=UPI00112B1E09|nr:hypothetical protein [Mesorhizobium sp. B2-4-17]TPK90998.1 hypothetical protein FJ548_04610 [Mesorhizobium sp. B2-4-17]
MLGSILQTVSVIIAAFSVVLGIGAWRRTMKGQRQFDLAEQAVEGFAEARSAFTYIRSPAGFGGEGSSRSRASNETEAQSQLLDQAFVAIERYNKRTDVFSKLMAIRYRFELHFGKEAAAPFSELKNIVDEIIIASRTLARVWPQQGKPMTESQFAKHLEQMHKAESVFWEGFEEPDIISARIDKMNSDINDTCRQIINPRRNLCSVLTAWYSEGLSFLSCGKH